MKILLADDDPVSLQTIRTFLSKAGHRVEVCENGEQALGVLTGDGAPQLALLDWMMPGMSGIEVCQQIGRRPNRGDRYIIILSGRNRKKDIAEGLLAGADDYLVKPIDLTEMIARVRVAERTLAAHNELRHHVEQLERLVRRHNLLGELAVRRVGNPLAEPTQAKSAPARTPPAKTPHSLSTAVGNLHGVLVFGQIFLETLRGLGVEARLETPEPSELLEDIAPPVYAAWTPILLPKQNAWLDILVETTPEGARTLAERIVHGSVQRMTNAPFETVALDAFAEAAGMGVSKLRSQFEEDHIASHTPIITRAAMLEGPALRRRPTARLTHRLNVLGHPLQLSLLEYRTPDIVKGLLELIEMDVLTQPPQALRPETPAPLQSWEALTGPMINRARRWTEDGIIEDAFHVMQPSPVARELATKLRT
ncbi:MAG: response regulator transcription factor [Opitutales bacterium]